LLEDLPRPWRQKLERAGHDCVHGIFYKGERTLPNFVAWGSVASGEAQNHRRALLTRCTYSSQSRRSEYITYAPEATSLMARLERLESGQVAAVNLAGDVLRQSEAHVLLTQLHDQLHGLHPITFVSSKGEELPLALNGQCSLGDLA
jgi:hypothetical protein